MKSLLLGLCALTAIALVSAAALTPLALAGPSDSTASSAGPDTIVVEILSRGSPDDPITWGGGAMKTRCFRVCCVTGEDVRGYNVCVEFGSGTKPNEIASALRDKVQALIDEPMALMFCDFTVDLANNAIVIKGRGAAHCVGTFDEPTYDGDPGSDLDAKGKPKNNPRCLLVAYANS